MPFQPTHEEKLYWKKEKITKGDLLDYYRTVAPTILPYLKNRPLVMHRFPEGIEGESFYQKEAPANHPSFVKTIKVHHEERIIDYILVNNLDTLLYVVNLGSIELHPFSAQMKQLQKPDYLILDLDPEGLPFDAVVEVANQIHALLDAEKVANFCKTSGSRGLHIYVPMKAHYDFDEVKSWAHQVAIKAHNKLPRTTSLERLPNKRQKKVYIDFLQNRQMQTVVAPYSVRGRPHATVSTPLLWSEVKEGLDPLDFTIKTVPKRLIKKGDPFKGVLGKGASIV